jgi:hypothetical protein
MRPPETYLKVPIPARIRNAWRTWEAAEWRRMQHANRGVLYGPDQRFTVSPPRGMCPVHRVQWQKWRDRYFKGRSFPGGCAGDGFLGMRYVYRPTPETVAEEWDRNRHEWDVLTCEQMRLVEEICLSGRSTQCNRATGEVAA